MSKTVKVRVAVAVDEDGDWTATGRNGAADYNLREDAANGVEGETIAYFWLTAELPIPEVGEVAASVERAGDE